MSKHHPFRFGLSNEHMTTREAWLAGAQRAEQLGYAIFLIRDHFAPDFFGDHFAPFAALMFVAMVTTTLRVGTLVIDNDYRHPIVLAKEAATLDLLSGGRFELGIGAGWLRSKYEQAGMSYDAAGVRVSRLAEAVKVLKGLFACEPLCYDGKHYTIRGLNGYPKPEQRPGVPLLIGGGHQCVLTLPGREADIAGVLTSSVASGTMTQDPLELSLVPNFIITDDRQGAAEQYIRGRGWDGICVDQVLSMPSVFICTLDQIAGDMLARRAQFGFSYYVVGDEQREEMAPLVARLAGK